MSCPDGMVQTKDLCVELAQRPADTWENAEDTCSSASRRLPSPGELSEAMDALGASQGFEWSSEIYSAAAVTAVALGDDASRHVLVSFQPETDPHPYRCVSTPVNTG